MREDFTSNEPGQPASACFLTAQALLIPRQDNLDKARAIVVMPVQGNFPQVHLVVSMSNSHNERAVGNCHVQTATCTRLVAASILYNLVDTVPSPRLRYELRLAPLLTQKCNRAISPGCRHATIYKTCLREDTLSAPVHTTVA